MIKTKVLCPKCNYVLFYRYEDSYGTTEHKCARCKSIETIELKPQLSELKPMLKD